MFFGQFTSMNGISCYGFFQPLAELRETSRQYCMSELYSKFFG